MMNSDSKPMGKHNWRILFPMIAVVTICLCMTSCNAGLFRKRVPARGSVISDSNDTAFYSSSSGKVRRSPDTLDLMLEKAGAFLSPVWNSRERIDQIITAIKYSSLDGLN